MKTKKLRWWEENELDGEENEKKKGGIRKIERKEEEKNGRDKEKEG